MRHSTVLTLDFTNAGYLEHSRPLDVHIWSNHPETNGFVDQIYEQLYSRGNKKIWKRLLKVVLIDLYVAWYHDPELKIAVSFNNNSYKPKSRYNELHISKRIIDVIRDLNAADLIELQRGFKDRETGVGRISRIWPTKILIDYFKKARFSVFEIGSSENREAIILRDKNKNEIDYVDNDETIRMRRVLVNYNALLRGTYVDIPSLKESFFTSTNERGAQIKRHIRQNEKFIFRIFNESFDRGGRFYGGWWQNCPKKLRRQIFIDDQPSIELDYSSFHIVLLYAMEGIPFPIGNDGDPYAVDHVSFLDDRKLLRQVAKGLLLIALNASSEENTFQAFRDKAPTGSPEKKFTNKQLSELLEVLKAKHNPIQNYFASGIGTSLMNLDSRICEYVVERCTSRKIPVLTVHDSFLVPYHDEQMLTKLMFEALNGMFKELNGTENTARNRLAARMPSNPSVIKTTRYKENYLKFKSWLSTKQENVETRTRQKRQHTHHPYC